MTAVLAGQILGLSIACGLNLYLTVAALGILSRLGIVPALPPGLQGLEGTIVIASAAALFIVETVLDKTPHIDSVWDTVHTFIRAPAAALLATAALWGEPAWLVGTAVTAAFLVALATHATKAGVRVALNTTMRGGQIWLSIAEDILALCFATLAFLDPGAALIGSGALLAALLLVGPSYWRAGRLGARCLAAWLRSLFVPAGWHEGDRIPARVRRLLDPTPLGGAPPRGARAALDAPGSGSYRNGWLIVTGSGPVFVYRGLLGQRRLDIPPATAVEGESGAWADLVRFETDAGTDYTLYLLKDGPTLDVVVPSLQGA